MKKTFVLLMNLWLAFGARAASIDITVERIQVQSMGTMIVYMLYDDPNSRVFVYPLLLSDGETDAVLGKTYVFPGEMNQAYAYWMLSDYTTHALYTQATFCKTDLGNGHTRIDATATDTNNDAFTLTYDESLQTLEKPAVNEHKHVQKTLQNGQIIIIQADKKYSITGNLLY
ncbi:MAG: hypothetical protein IJQ32_00475 [Paludibacteraceae bacterium]|nr:hypothetical protein [Paludibacteraceae bacterium]